MEEISQITYDPVVNYVFGAFSLILLGFVFWLIKRVFALFGEYGKIISRSCEVLTQNTEITAKVADAVDKMHEKILACPTRKS